MMSLPVTPSGAKISANPGCLNITTSEEKVFDLEDLHTLRIIPPRVSARGYKIGPVCASVCVYVC